MIEVGKTYRFDPMIEAAGIYKGGEVETTYPRLRFTSGTCIKKGEYGHEFRGQPHSDSDTYTFFALPEKLGVTITLISS